MKVLWLDTGPLLELVAHELGAAGASREAQNASRRLQDKLISLSSKARLSMFEDSFLAGGFGEVRFSSGSLVELYNHARQPLGGDASGVELLAAFWTALPKISVRLQRPVASVPMVRSSMDPGMLSLLGPVDAHLLAELSTNKEAWLFTTDGPLQRAVPDLSQSRLFQMLG